ncbi:hypothetical protein BN133_2429 [Cronobacter dublinensis 582]|nr:hypothetical protein BN133_2429 [Cronobacter dublinensis 582]
MLYLRGVTERQLAFDIIEKDVHAQRFRQDAELGADMAVADNPQLFAACFIRACRQFVPDTAMRFGVCFRNTAQQQQQLADHQFSHRAGVRERRVKNRNAALRRRVQIHLVGADAEAADRHQFFRSGENLFSQMSTGSQADKMRIADGRFQLLAVERALVIFNVGITCGAQAIDGFLVNAFHQQEFNFVFLQRYFCHFPTLSCLNCYEAEISQPSVNISKFAFPAI